MRRLPLCPHKKRQRRDDEQEKVRVLPVHEAAAGGNGRERERITGSLTQHHFYEGTATVSQGNFGNQQDGLELKGRFRLTAKEQRSKGRRGGRRYGVGW
jgi:hypothetical protein